MADEININQDITFDAGIGKLSVSEETVAMIALTECELIPGVINVTHDVASEFYGIIGNNAVKGVKVEVGNKETIISIPICIEYGRVIIDVARKVQAVVSSAVEQLTELKVKEVNIAIVEVRNNHKKTWNVLSVYDCEPEVEKEYGPISVEESVVAYIAGTVARTVEGVSDLSSGLASEIAGFFSHSKRGNARGIKVELGKKQAIIDAYIIVQFGARVPDVAWNIQEAVKAKIEALTPYIVVEVNIMVQGIDFNNPLNEI